MPIRAIPDALRRRVGSYVAHRMKPRRSSLSLGAAILARRGRRCRSCGHAGRSLTCGVDYRNGRGTYAPARYTITINDNGPDIAFAAPRDDHAVGRRPQRAAGHGQLHRLGAGRSATSETSPPERRRAITLETLPDDDSRARERASRCAAARRDPQPGTTRRPSSRTWSWSTRAPPPPPPAADTRARRQRHHRARATAAPSAARSKRIRGRASDDRSGVGQRRDRRTAQGRHALHVAARRDGHVQLTAAEARRCAEPAVAAGAGGPRPGATGSARGSPRGPYVIVVTGHGRDTARPRRRGRGPTGNLVQFKVR